MHNKESNPRSYQQILWKKPTQKTLKKSGVKKEKNRHNNPL